MATNGAPSNGKNLHGRVLNGSCSSDPVNTKNGWHQNTDLSSNDSHEKMMANNGSGEVSKGGKEGSSNDVKCAVNWSAHVDVPASSDLAQEKSSRLDLSHSESRVLVIYTGGTIGMVKSRNGALAPIRNVLEAKIRSSASLHDAAYAKDRFGADGPLVLPITDAEHRVIYTIREYEILIDSSNMRADDWVQIACDIKDSYEQYEGFVILHGTDTLAYTSSALSFLLENLGKTVVITGSQIPLWELRSDGRDNLILSLIIAGNYLIPEVTVLFNNALYRGNRTVKVSAAELAAFDSPNFPPIATVGIHINVDYRLVLRPTMPPLRVHTKICRDVGLLRIFPGISEHAVRSFLAPPLRGAVLQTYGAGNVPSDREEFIDALREATDRGVLLVNCTQCSRGSVAIMYETSKALEAIGVVCGSDMTAEAALTKLCYVLSKDEWDTATKKENLGVSLRGELTPRIPSALEGHDILANMLHSYPGTSGEVTNILMAALTCAAAAKPGDTALAALIKAGANPVAAARDLRTPLHVACFEGNLKAVQMLLQHGGSVHARDSFGRTPLLDAVHRDRHDVIEVLRRCGAHLAMSTQAIGDKLCEAAARGEVKTLESFKLAGANMNALNTLGWAALHVAATAGLSEVAKFLLDAGANPLQRNRDGRTSLDLARSRGHALIEKAIEAAIRQ